MICMSAFFTVFSFNSFPRTTPRCFGSELLRYGIVAAVAVVIKLLLGIGGFTKPVCSIWTIGLKRELCSSVQCGAAFHTVRLIIFRDSFFFNLYAGAMLWTSSWPYHHHYYFLIFVFFQKLSSKLDWSCWFVTELPTASWVKRHVFFCWSSWNLTDRHCLFSRHSITA
jgi:hypothetical protein